MSNFTTIFKVSNKRTIEFVDIPLSEDLEAFICPFLIANNRDEVLVDKIYNQMTAFFTKLNRDYIKPNDKKNALLFLSHLHEPNEYHLGYSLNNSGKAIDTPRAETIFFALRNNRFTKSAIGITNEAHNILLLVNGIGQDIMSDTIANVCRDLFADFTEKCCIKLGIPTTPCTVEYFDAKGNKWESREFDLPLYNGKPIILTPKKLVSGDRAYSNLYNRFVASNYISVEKINSHNKKDEQFIKQLKDGTKKAIIKEILNVYKKPKSELIDYVIKYNGSLLEFLDYAKKHYPELNLDYLKE